MGLCPWDFTFEVSNPSEMHALAWVIAAHINMIRMNYRQRRKAGTRILLQGLSERRRQSQTFPSPPGEELYKPWTLAVFPLSKTSFFPGIFVFPTFPLSNDLIK